MFISALFGWYFEWLEAMPLLAKSITAGVLLGAGDYLTQRFDKKEIDFGRTLRIMLLAALLGTPALNLWYTLLDSNWPDATWQHILIKLIFDQFFFTPLSIVLFFGVLGLGEGKSGKEIVNEIKIGFLPTLKTSLLLWPIASFVNFWLIDAKYRLFFVGCVSIFWNTYLSAVKHHLPEKPLLPIVDPKSH
uniref:Uncharacterized protein n=1 Tax=Arcella intermedia TaxID=1963864 RepID=A0A6B2LKP1_9EUKA